MALRKHALMMAACLFINSCGDTNSFSTVQKSADRIDSAVGERVSDDKVLSNASVPDNENSPDDFNRVPNQEEAPEKEEIVREAPESEDPPKEAVVVEEVFRTSTVQTPIDVVWTVDNSGSMGEEVENVRKNFSFFMDTVKQQLDVKVALLSSDCKESGLAFRRCLDLKEDEKSRVNLWLEDPHRKGASLGVGSTNALALLSSASCEENKTNLEQYKICNINVSQAALNHPSKRDYIGFRDDVFDSAGGLVNFFRKESKKVFIVVTDDSPTGFYADSYLKTMDTLFGRGNHVFYSFSFIPGKESGEDCRAGFGGAEKEGYIYLSQKTFGETYNICEQNWEQHFRKLTKSIKSVAAREFTTKYRCQEIVKVTVDDIELTNEQFAFKLPSRLSISEGVLLPKEQKIVINCKV